MATVDKVSCVLILGLLGLLPCCVGHAVFGLLSGRRTHLGVRGRLYRWCEVVIHCCWWATIFSQVGVVGPASFFFTELGSFSPRQRFRLVLVILGMCAEGIKAVVSLVGCLV